MSAGYGSNGGLTVRAVRALVVAQVRRVRGVGMVVPMAVSALIVLVGACLTYAVGTASATMAMLAFMQVYPLVVGICAVAVFAGDSLVEVQVASPVEFRAVQTLRAFILLVTAAAGALVMFIPLEALGIVYHDIGWAGVAGPVGGAALMVLVAYVTVAVVATSRNATLVMVATWLFFALVWDPNVSPLMLQRGVPLLVALAAGVCVWRALGAPEYAWRKLGGVR